MNTGTSPSSGRLEFRVVVTAHGGIRANARVRMWCASPAMVSRDSIQEG